MLLVEEFVFMIEFVFVCEFSEKELFFMVMDMYDELVCEI